MSLGTIRGWVRSDRPLFLTLNAIWIYVGAFALLAKLPGITTLVRSTFSATSFGWFVVIATGLRSGGLSSCIGWALPDLRPFAGPTLTDNHGIHTERGLRPN